MKLHPKTKLILTLLLTLFLISFTSSAGAVVYTYDELNRLTSATYPNGQKLTYTYDAGGNILSVSHDGGSQIFSVKSTIPAKDAAGVPVDQDISVAFSAYVQPGSAYDSISFTDDSNNPVEFVKAVSDDTLTLYLVSSLNYNTQYTVKVPANAVTDTVNNSLASDYLFSFTTEDTVAPVVISTDPADNETGILTDKKISVTFSVYVQPGSAYDNISVKNPKNKSMSITKTISGDTLTISPVSDLKYNTMYTVTIPAGSVTDALDNDLLENYIFSFTTKDTVAPVVISADPDNKETGVPVDKTITVTFNENVLPGETYDNISLTDKKDSPVEFTKNLSGAVLTIVPLSDLAEITIYKVKIPAGAVKNLSDNILKKNKTFKFTTWDRTPPTVESSDPGNDETGVKVHKPVKITFSEEIQEGAAYDSITLKDAQGDSVVVSSVIRKDKLIIVPEADLSQNTFYTVTVPAQAVKDMADNDLADDYILSFTTRAKK